jgi:FlaG/FlaF family flagellin (archaellin)
MLHSVGRLCLVIVGGLVLSGCGGGGGPKKAAVYKVTGKITFQGAPLPRAIVTFSPKDVEQPAIYVGQNARPVAFGMTDDKGEFILTTYIDGDGAAAGNYGVVVTKAASAGAKTDAGHSADPAVLAKMSTGHDASISAESSSVIPPDYADAKKTPLNATVDPKGKNEFTFEIK